MMLITTKFMTNIKRFFSNNIWFTYTFAFLNEFFIEQALLKIFLHIVFILVSRGTVWQKCPDESKKRKFKIILHFVQLPWGSLFLFFFSLNPWKIFQKLSFLSKSSQICDVQILFLFNLAFLNRVTYLGYLKCIK